MGGGPATPDLEDRLPQFPWPTSWNTVVQFWLIIELLTSKIRNLSPYLFIYLCGRSCCNSRVSEEGLGGLQLSSWFGTLRQWGCGFDGMAYMCVFGGFQGGALPTGSGFWRVSRDTVCQPGRISDMYGCGVGFGDVPIGLCCDTSSGFWRVSRDAVCQQGRISDFWYVWLWRGIWGCSYWFVLRCRCLGLTSQVKGMIPFLPVTHAIHYFFS